MEALIGNLHQLAMAAHAGSLPHHSITNLAKKYDPIIPMSHIIDNAFVYFCLQETEEEKKCINS